MQIHKPPLLNNLYVIQLYMLYTVLFIIKKKTVILVKCLFHITLKSRENL